MKDLIKLVLNEQFGKNLIEIPNIPNTMNFWHGGNMEGHELDDMKNKKGRFEDYGAGLYLTTSYNVVERYTKGKRKLYLITVEKGNEIQDVDLPLNDVVAFIKKYVTPAKRNTVYERLKKYDDNGMVKAYLFNNIVLNEEAIRHTHSLHMRQFLIDHNVDYEIVENAFGWGEQLMVLYNMKKIKNIIRIKPTDKIPVLDLHKMDLQENISGDEHSVDDFLNHLNHDANNYKPTTYRKSQFVKDIGHYTEMAWKISGKPPKTKEHEYTFWNFDGRFQRGVFTVYATEEHLFEISEMMVEWDSHFESVAVLVSHPYWDYWKIVNIRGFETNIDIENDSEYGNAFNDYWFKKKLMEIIENH